MPAKCFNTPIQNALCRCQFRDNWVKIGDTNPYWILTPNERVLSHQVPDVYAKFHQNWLKIATVRARTDRQTDKHTHRDDTGDLIICPMLCYSNGMGQIITAVWVRQGRIALIPVGKTWGSARHEKIYNGSAWLTSKVTPSCTPLRSVREIRLGWNAVKIKGHKLLESECGQMLYIARSGDNTMSEESCGNW